MHFLLLNVIRPSIIGGCLIRGLLNGTKKEVFIGAERYARLTAHEKPDNHAWSSKNSFDRKIRG